MENQPTILQPLETQDLQLNTGIPNTENAEPIFPHCNVPHDKFSGKVYSRQQPAQVVQSSMLQQLKLIPLPSPAPIPSDNLPLVSSQPDVPIALRKGVRTCTTQYPLSHYVSYDKLFSLFSCFMSNLSTMEILKDIQAALQDLEWKNVVLEEMRALEKNKTWDTVPLLEGKKTVGCKWVFVVNSDGSLERYKACLVAKGFTQTYGFEMNLALGFADSVKPCTG